MVKNHSLSFETLKIPGRQPNISRTWNLSSHVLLCVHGDGTITAACGRSWHSTVALNQCHGKKLRAECYSVQESKNVTMMYNTKCSAFVSSY